MREAESETVRIVPPGPPKGSLVQGGSPDKKRPRLTSPPQTPISTDSRPMLEEITNSINLRNEIASFKVSENTYKIPRIGERKVYRKIPKEGDFQTVTMSDGERFYLKLKDDESEAVDTEKMSKPSRFLGLCGESYSSLFEQAIQVC